MSHTATLTARPITALARKTARQPARWMKKPPRAGPVARPIPAADRRTPRLHPVRSGLDTAAVMAVDMGMAMASPHGHDHPAGDQLREGLGGGRQRRARAVERNPQPVEAVAAEDVPCPAQAKGHAGGQHQPHGGDPLHRREAAAELGLDAGDGDVDAAVAVEEQEGARGQNAQHLDFTNPRLPKVKGMRTNGSRWKERSDGTPVSLPGQPP